MKPHGTQSYRGPRVLLGVALLCATAGAAERSASIGAAAAGTDAPSRCASTITAATIQFATTRLRAIDDCARRVARGASIDNCLPADGPVTDALTRRRLGHALAAARARIAGDCPRPPALRAPCADAGTARELATCATVGHDADPDLASSDGLLAVLYETAPRGIDRHALRCRLALTGGVARYFAVRTGVLRTCRESGAVIPSAGGAVCPDAAGDAAIEAARAALEETVRLRCPDPSAAPPLLALGGECADALHTNFSRLAVPGNPDANVVRPLDAMLRCATNAAASAADRLVGAAEYGIAPRPFRDGVAAGDVTDDAAVFWTRLPHPGAATLEIAVDPTFLGYVRRIPVEGAASDDGAVRVDVAHLFGGTTYSYRFVQGGSASPTGTIVTAPLPTRIAPTPPTLPLPGEPVPLPQVTVAWAAGSNAAFQPFSVLHALRAANPDLFLYTGNTIYADDPRDDGVVAVTVDEFSAKYRRNRRDAALRDLLQSTATYAVWDDREVRAHWSGTAPAFGALADAGRTAFRRWFPLRDQPGGVLYRRVRWGSLIELFLLDARSYRSPTVVCCADGSAVTVDDPATTPCAASGGVAAQADDACRSAMAQPSRTVLGAEQTTWLEAGLQDSNAAFKLVIGGPAMFTGPVYPYDRWEDYAVERGALLDFVRDHRINAVWFGGGVDGAVVASPGVDAAHREAGLTAGVLGANRFRSLLTDTLREQIISGFPSAFPAVSGFELQSPTAVVITFSDLGVPVAKVRYLDAAGRTVASVTLRGAS